MRLVNSEGKGARPTPTYTPWCRTDNVIQYILVTCSYVQPSHRNESTDTTAMEIVQPASLVKADGAKKPASEVVGGKDIIAFYFSAHWCPPCRAFTPILKDFYEVNSN